MSRAMIVHGRLLFRRLLEGLSLAVLVATSTGCVAALMSGDSGPSDAERRQIQQESAPYMKKGSASISGVVGIETASGTVTPPGGTQVYLTPATTLANERLQKYAIGKNELPEHRQAELLWMSRTDPQGRFQFKNLPAGEYILACQVAWSPPGDPSDRRSDIAYARVRLAPGESVTATVTRPATR